MRPATVPTVEITSGNAGAHKPGVNQMPTETHQKPNSPEEIPAPPLTPSSLDCSNGESKDERAGYRRRTPFRSSRGPRRSALATHRSRRAARTRRHPDATRARASGRFADGAPSAAPRDQHAHRASGRGRIPRGAVPRARRAAWGSVRGRERRRSRTGRAAGRPPRSRVRRRADLRSPRTAAHR